MPKHGRNKLVPQSMALPEEQSLEVTEEPPSWSKENWTMKLNAHDVMASWNLIPVLMH